MEGGATWSTDFCCVALLPLHRPPREEQPRDDYANPQTVRDNKEMTEENGVCACMRAGLVRLVLLCKQCRHARMLLCHFPLCTHMYVWEHSSRPLLLTLYIVHMYTYLFTYICIVHIV